MAEITWRPLITKWPKPETRRRRSSSWDYHKGLPAWVEHLDRELVHLKVREALIEVDADPVNFKKYGGLFADAKVRTPKVMLTFDLPDVGAVVYACDSYHSYQENIHAIGLTLERLRLVDSYGATTGKEQYRGFKRLPPAGGTSEEREFTVEEAALALVEADPGCAVMENGAREVLASTVRTVPHIAKMIARNAIKATHPDTGGDAGRYLVVERARRVLIRHHGSEL